MLKPQGIAEFNKIFKKQNDSLKETSLIILTFDKANLADKIRVAYVTNKSSNVMQKLPSICHVATALRAFILIWTTV